MAIYEIEAPNGQVFEIEGDSPPNEQELEQIFTSIQTPQQANIPIEAPQMPQTLPAMEQPRQEMTWGQASLQGLKNIPKSTWQMAKDIGGAIASPVQTVKSIGNLAGGLAVKGAKALTPNTDYLPELEAMEKYPEAMGQFYKQRYGGSENIKQTLATDPAGLISDLATALTLGGGAISKVGKASKLGQIGKGVAKVGNVIEPINLAGRGIGALGLGAGKIMKYGLGMSTGAGSGAVGEAVKSGRTGRKIFKENIRNKVPQREVLPLVSDALDTIRMKAKNDYTSDMGKVLNDPTILDVAPIQNKMLDLIEDTAYKNFEKIGKKSKLKMDEMTKVIAEMESKPAIHTAEGLDAVKRRLNEIEIPYDSRMAERARTTLTNTIKDTIKKQHPVYADVMKNWWEMEELNNQMKKTLSLNPNATIDTQLRKLQSVMRNNVNTGYGHRLDLVKELNKYNPDILPALAGQSLSSITPRGLPSITATGAGVTGLTTNPLTLLTLPAFSPRIVGESAYLTGQLQDILNKIPLSNISRGLYQAGRTDRVTGQ